MKALADRILWSRYGNATSLRLLSEWGLEFMNVPSVKDEATGVVTVQCHVLER